MIFWFLVTAALMIWNAIYCARRAIADLRGAKPASGVWGLFALAGALSTLAFIVMLGLVARSGI